jgi:hypothetical protein
VQLLDLLHSAGICKFLKKSTHDSEDTTQTIIKIVCSKLDLRRNTGHDYKFHLSNLNYSICNGYGGGINECSTQWWKSRG